MELILALCIGLGLSAACGFRIFIPLLLMSLAASSGHLELAAGFEWIASPAAVTAFGAATVLEILAYYIPAVDNLLDTLATPSAAVAGTIATAAVVTDMSPFLAWSLAVIMGGGSALTVQTVTSITRLASTGTTAGFGNPIVSTAEAASSTFLSLLALLVPALAALIVLLLLIFTIRKLIGFIRARRAKTGIVPAASGSNFV
jgi:hypothetical protein